MPSERVDLPVWVLAFLGLLVLALFLGVRILGPAYVAIPVGEDPDHYERLKEVLRARDIPFIVTESELWIPRRELDRLRADHSLPVDVVFAR